MKRLVVPIRVICIYFFHYMVAIRCILFDMDWVLIDARERHANAFIQACKEVGTSITHDFHALYLESLPTKKKTHILIEKWLVQEKDAEKIYHLKQAYTEKIITQSNLYSEQKVWLMKQLKDEWYLLWVCSNSIRASVEEITKKMWVFDYFDCVFSNNDVEKPKPDPEIYTKAIERLWCTPHTTLVIEDSEVWIHAAKASWAHVLCVQNASEVTWERIHSCLWNA